jgi:CBS-domain-containing membrane protein
MTDQSKHSMFTVAHLTVTLAILAFCFGLYERYRDFSAHAESEIARLQAKVDAEAETERVRHAAVDAQLNDLNRRVDIHRDDIRALQAQLNSHVDNKR